MYALVWCRPMESCHPQKGGLSVCTASTPLFIVCTPICPALVSRVCVCVCVGCVSMSLLWSEMTLRSAAILPTVNIIQYHPTGINMVVLLLAEMCCCSSFLSQQHFLAPTRFLLGGCVRWWLMIQIYRKKGWAAVLSSGSVVSRVSFCTCTRVRLLDYSVYPSPSPHLHNVCLTKRANMAGVDSSAWVIIKCALSFSMPFLLHFFFYFPPLLCDWLWWGGVWRELMTGMSTAEMSDQMLSQHDHQPDPCRWIMNTAHLNSDL